MCVFKIQSELFFINIERPYRDFKVIIIVIFTAVYACDMKHIPIIQEAYLI